MAYVYEVPSYY